MTRWPARSRRGLACRQAVELLTDYLENVLPRSLRGRLEAHLADCPDCPEYVAQMRATIALVGSTTLGDLGPPVPGDLLVLYRRWRADQARGR